VLLVLLLVLFDIPMLWLILAPTKTEHQLAFDSPLSIGSPLNYLVALGHLQTFPGGNVGTWLANSVAYAAASVALALVLTLPAGYALAAFHFKGRRVLMVATLVALTLPSSASVLPLFLEMGALHLLNNPLSIILPSAFTPFGVYLAYIYFSTSLPPEILDAGRVDGASERQIFTAVALPLAKPVIALVSFFTFTAQWNNFFLVTVMLSDPARSTLQVGLSYVMAVVFSAGATPLDAGQVRQPEIALAAVILALPVVVFFAFVQRYLLKGLLAGYGVG
jgi:multiple sugar transport system permease protein